MEVDLRPTVDVDEEFAKLKKLQWLSTGFLVVAVAAGVALVGSTWNWAYFFWGAGAGVLAVVLTRGMLRLGYRSLRASTKDIARARAQVRRRYTVTYVSTVVSGVGMGAFSARTGSPWPDVFITAIAALAQVPALVMLPKLRRRALATRTGTSVPSD